MGKQAMFQSGTSLVQRVQTKPDMYKYVLNISFGLLTISNHQNCQRSVDLSIAVLVRLQFE